MGTNGHPRWQTGNLFLDSLGDKTAATLLPLLSKEPQPLGKQIAFSGQQIELVTFPKRSAISTVKRMRDGEDVEVALIGREGFHGLQVILGDGTSTTEAVIQLADSSYTISAAQFREIVMADEHLLGRVLRYAQTLLETIGQFSGCNRLHQIEERSARWLLMAHDRQVLDELSLTHEFMATMLGVRRPSVTLALGSLERAGLIKLGRGKLTITDRASLQNVTCECYDDSNRILRRLMHYGIENRGQMLPA